MAADAARRSQAGFLLALGQVRFQLLLLLRSPLGFFLTFVVPLLLLVSLNVITPTTAALMPRGLRCAQFLTPAISAFCLLNACYVTTVTSIVLAREEGILKRLRGTPLPAWTYLAGRCGALVTAIVSAGIIVVTGVLFFHVTIVWPALGYFADAAGLGIGCFFLLRLHRQCGRAFSSNRVPCCRFRRGADCLVFSGLAWSSAARSPVSPRMTAPCFASSGPRSRSLACISPHPATRLRRCSAGHRWEVRWSRSCSIMAGWYDW